MQKFRGLDPRTAFLRWGLLGITLGIIAGATAPQAVDLLIRATGTQHDALPWYASRLLAFLAYLAIAASVVYGLMLSTGVLDAIAHRPISFNLHQDLASAGLGLAAVHAALLLLDRSVPFAIGEVLVPFASPYRPVWVGFGQLGLYLTLVVVASFYLRRRIGQRAWRALHSVTFLAFVGVTAHGILSGTDTGTTWAWWIYTGSAAIVAFLFTYRIVVALTGSGRRSGRPAPARSEAG